MAFETLEESLEDGRPIELFEFTIGLEIFRFTSSEENIDFGGFTHVAVPMNRTQPKVNQDEPGSSVVVSMATNHADVQDFSRAWIARAPNTGDVRVRIWRHHKNDVDFQIFWIGYMVSANYEQNGALTSVNCKSLDNIFTLQGPRKNWGTLCNHQLYDVECKLNIADFTQGGTVTNLAADGVTYTVSGISAPVVRHNGGTILVPGTLASALIVAVPVANSQFKIQYPNPDIEVGSTVNIIEGCEHNLTDCGAFPNAGEPSNTNTENFGASPYTPPVNLFTKGGDAL